MKNTKVSNNKSDLQGYSRSLVLPPFDTIFYKSSIETMSLFCTVSEILSLISQNLNRSRTWPWTHMVLFGANLSGTH